MEQLQKRVDDLDKAFVFHCEESNRVWKELLDAKDELMKAHMETVDGTAYATKLERLKAYIEQIGVRCSVRYAFHKDKEPYKTDDHEAMEDPLNWNIHEYDMLAIETWVDIIFYYHNEAVKTFVDTWMKKNMEKANSADEEEFSR